MGEHLRARTFWEASKIVKEFDDRFGSRYFALLLGLRDHNVDAAMAEYDALLLDVWLFVRGFSPSPADLEKMHGCARDWCDRRFAED